MEVHKHLGPGFPAETYRDCLAHELRLREIVFQRDHAMSIVYKGLRVESAVRVDFLVEGTVLLAAGVQPLGPDVKSRMRNVLLLTGFETGMLVNFDVGNMRDGVKRIIVAEQPPALYYR